MVEAVRQPIKGAAEREARTATSERQSVRPSRAGPARRLRTRIGRKRFQLGERLVQDRVRAGLNGVEDAGAAAIRTMSMVIALVSHDLRPAPHLKARVAALK